MPEKAVFGNRNQAAQSRDRALGNLHLFLKGALLAYYWGPVLYKSGGRWLPKVPEKAAFGAQSLAAKSRFSESHLPTKMGVAGCKKCLERPLSAPEVWLPNNVIQDPEFCANTGGPAPYKNGPYWLQKRPGEGAQKAAFGTRNQAGQ